MIWIRYDRFPAVSTDGLVALYQMKGTERNSNAAANHASTSHVTKKTNRFGSSQKGLTPMESPASETADLTRVEELPTGAADDDDVYHFQ